MTKFKKMIAVLMSVAMIVCMFTVPTSAASIFDNAQSISALDTVSGEGKKSLDYYYKVKLNDSGKITFHCSDYSSWGEKLTLMDANGNTIIERDSFEYRIEKEYDIEKKGTYYIRVQFTSAIPSWDSFKNLYYSFNPSKTPVITLSFSMKVGDKIDFSAVTSNYKGNVTWKTTKSSVATVNKGTIKAVKKGKAQIRAYMDNGDYAEIIIKVTK